MQNFTRIIVILREYSIKTIELLRFSVIYK
jgi:hypothetical protein